MPYEGNIEPQNLKFIYCLPTTAKRKRRESLIDDERFGLEPDIPFVCTLFNIKAYLWQAGLTRFNFGSWPASVETSEKSSFFKLKKERNVRIIVGYYNLTYRCQYTFFLVPKPLRYRQTPFAELDFNLISRPTLEGWLALASRPGLVLLLVLFKRTQ